MLEFSSSQPLLFLSDAHLGGFPSTKNQEIEQKLIQLVDYCQERQIKLFILGDLFDYWMEYPGHVPELGQRLLDRFESYNKVLGPTLFITGNHDNWTRNHLQERGFLMETDYRHIKAGGNRLLLLHGDGLIAEDGKLVRPPMHRLLRNKTFISYYQKILPPKAGLQVMKWFSQLNRLFGSFRENPVKLNNWAEQALEQSEAEIIICGHDHFPRTKNFRFGTYVNLGTFYQHQTMALYNKEGIDLVVWNDRNREFDNYAHGQILT